MSKKNIAQTQPKAIRVVPEKIHLVKVTITNAQVNGPSNSPDGWDNVTMNINASTFFNEATGCRVVLVIDLHHQDDDPSMEIKANFTIEFLIEVENLQDFKIAKVENEIQLDSKLGASLMGIVYSTARGIILTRTAGTALQGIILPVIDPASLLPGNTNN